MSAAVNPKYRYCVERVKNWPGRGYGVRDRVKGDLIRRGIDRATAQMLVKSLNDDSAAAAPQEPESDTE